MYTDIKNFSRDRKQGSPPFGSAKTPPIPPVRRHAAVASAVQCGQHYNRRPAPKTSRPAADDELSPAAAGAVERWDGGGGGRGTAAAARGTSWISQSRGLLTAGCCCWRCWWWWWFVQGGRVPGRGRIHYKRVERVFVRLSSLFLSKTI